MKRPNLSTDSLIALIGLTALAVGLALFSIPLAFAIVGALLILYSVIPDHTPGGPTP